MSKPQPRPTPAAAKAPNRVPAGGPRTVIPVKGPAKPRTPVPKAPYSKPTSTASKPPAPRTAAPKPAATRAPPAEAPKAGNWINRTVQNSVAGVGNYGASFVYSLGGGVNKVGEGIGNSITNTTRYWGQGVAGYGNNIKDSVGVGGARISTAGNPLGMAGMGAGQGALPGGKAATGRVISAGKGSAGNHLGI
ncbi:hypothetical protein LTR08_006288 [Meristemomyces frigidus]|nr:hypothetical protein LTR08_006288 [Meristemomyces frigidus]